VKRTLTAEQVDALRSVPLVDGLPNKLRIAMGMLKVNQVDIIEGTGFSQPYVSDVVRGKVNRITVENARKFADYFGCAIEDLFPSREAVAS
jgi:predicted XRE-type DNA-binding protein